MPGPSWGGLLNGLLDRVDLDEADAVWAMDQIMSGTATPAQIGAFLIALRSKGASGAEISSLVGVMMEHAVRVSVPGPSVDTCGTGGDHSGSVNISTMAAIAVAATGARVVKHGNRAASSRSGSADVLEELGVAVSIPAERVAECVERAGIAFCFAPTFHPAMRFAGPVRREIGVPTVFNVLGPLANPAEPQAQVVGVADLRMAPKVAEALGHRGTKALVVRGSDGLDEISTMDETRIWDCRSAALREVVLAPEDMGIGRAPTGSLAGGDAAFNARVARDALSGDPTGGVAPVRDAVVVNAAAALVCVEDVGRTRSDYDVGTEIREAVPRVRSALDAGAGERVLERWADVSTELAG